MNSQNESLLGTGSFGKVYQSIRNGQAVAIKKTFFYDIQLSNQELAIHRQLQHPNIVAFLGVESVSNSLHLILELMPDGDLFKLIVAGPIDPVVQYSIALDIAYALNYLHDMRIIHRDLKPENILLDRRNSRIIAKIADFGIAASEDDTESLKQVGGTEDYIAPELFITGAFSYPYSPKSDVYAFAIIMWTMITRRNMFQNTHKIQESVLLGGRGDFSDETHSDYQNLISTCWAQDPRRRPAISEVIPKLSRLESSPNSLPASQLKSTDQYPDVFQSIQDLENYGQFLCENDRSVAGSKARILAQHLRIVVKSLVKNTLTKTEAAEKISTLLKDGQHTLGQDRLCRDIIANIIIACTGIGLIVMIINKYYTGQFFLNTNRQNKLTSIHHAVKAADLNL